MVLKMQHHRSLIAVREFDAVHAVGPGDGRQVVSGHHPKPEPLKVVGD